MTESRSERPHGRSSGGYVDSAPFVQTGVFTLPEGRILVHLPRELYVRDQFVASIELEPRGNSHAERKKNARALGSYSFRFLRKSIRVRQGILQASLDRTIKGLFFFVLTHGSRQAAMAMFQCEPSRAEPEKENPDRLYFPWGGEAGQPTVIRGAFEDKATEYVVRIGGRETKIIAATSRVLIVQVPPDVPGGCVIEVLHGTRVWQGRFIVAHVEITYPRRASKGKPVDLTIRVSGIEDVNRPLPLRLLNSSSEVVQIPANLTQVRVNPKEIVAGVYTTTLALPALGSGSVSLAASIAPFIFLASVYLNYWTCWGCKSDCDEKDEHCDPSQPPRDGPEADDLGPIAGDPGVRWKRVRFTRTQCTEFICRNFNGTECCRFTMNVSRTMYRWKKSTSTDAQGNPVWVAEGPGAPCDCGTFLELVMQLGTAGLDKATAFSNMAKTRCPGLVWSEAGRMATSCGIKEIWDKASTLTGGEWYELAQRLFAAGGRAFAGTPNPLPPNNPPVPTGK